MTLDGRPDWRKASRSAGSGDTCVETGWTESAVGYRDSKQVGGPELWFPMSAARVFIAKIVSAE